jgi:hypothetical protein
MQTWLNWSPMQFAKLGRAASSAFAPSMSISSGNPGNAMKQERKAPERYFYHSFPRRGRETAAEIEKGCHILSIMKDVGLVMAPEIVKWEYEHADGSPARTSEVLQQRVCFTELEPRELPRHARKFGRFALEFTVPTLKSLGAIPVFYVPRAMSTATGVEGAASTLVMQFIDAMILVMRIAGVRSAIATSGQREGTFPCTFGFKESGNKTFDLEVGETTRVLEAFTHAITPPDILLPALEGMLKFFDPADDLGHDEVLGYYRQREWRIASNMAIRGVEMMRRPSPELIARLKTLDDDFFGREFPPNSGKTLAEEVFVLPGLGDRRILQMVNRIIVPEEAMSKVQAILKDLSDALLMASLESLGLASQP